MPITEQERGMLRPDILVLASAAICLLLCFVVLPPLAPLAAAAVAVVWRWAAARTHLHFRLVTARASVAVLTSPTRVPRAL